MNDAVMGRVRPVIRQLGWVVLGCMALGAVVTVVALRHPRPPDYDAKALVVGSALTISTSSLPQYGDTIFGSGDVAQNVATQLHLKADPASLIPDRIYVESAKDGIVFTVHGRSDDPDFAAKLANAAATAFERDLNKAGKGVGTFSIQATAQPPRTITTEPSSTLRNLLVGMLVGAVFGLGLVVLVAILRHPVTDGRTAAGVLHTPLIATITLPRLGRSRYSGPVAVPGLAPLLRFVSADDIDRIELVTPPGAAAVRERLALVLGLALAVRQPVSLLGSKRLLASADHHLDDRAVVEHDDLDPQRDSPRDDLDDEWSGEDEAAVMTIVDGADLDARLGQPPEPGTVTVLVVPIGYSFARLKEFRTRVTDEDLSGLVLIRQGWRRAAEIFSRIDDVNGSRDWPRSGRWSRRSLTSAQVTREDDV